jgi:cathepsin L
MPATFFECPNPPPPPLTPHLAAEFKASLSGFKSKHSQAAEARRIAAPAPLHEHVPVSALPSSLDWREKGVVTPVKDQGQCGGCWSFSSAETSESMVAIATGKLMVFSEQQILSCSTNPLQCGGTGGCSGATQEIAFNYSAQAGLTLEKDYPYRAQTGRCDATKIKPAAHIKGYVYLPPNNYSALMNAVVSAGPIAVSGAAEPWQSYESGVFESSCGTDVDHAIVLVGYGTDSDGKDYWLIRNSWSAGWGENGYIRLARYGDSSKGEPCGTDRTPGDGDGCKGGPPTEQVCGICGIMSDSSYAVGASL